MNFLPKRFFKFLILSLFAFFLINVGVVVAQNLSNWQGQLDSGASTKYNVDQFDSNDIATYVGTLIAWTPMLGLTFIMQMVLAGYEWMTASGDTAKLDDAKKRILHAVIGLCIFIGLYAIAYFIFDKLIIVSGYKQ